MPEGDTVFRTARTLQNALAGRTVTRFESVFPQLTRLDSQQPLRGRVVDRVTARGKHLFIWFSGDLILRTHMRMRGSWHIYRPGERWMRAATDMRIVVGTDAFDAIAFDVPVAEFLTERELGRQPVVRELGPDPLGEDFDAADAVGRIQARGDVAIADALLDQQAIAGIGNIYKSETLFACGVNPFTRVSELPAGIIEKLVTTAMKLLRAAVSESAGRGRWSVYGRGGEPCRRCGTPIAMRKQGPHARSTYWCERCQSVTP